MTSTLNFGLVGRCACGELGRRRAAFADEPICARCVPERTSFLRATTVDEAQELHAMMVGRLTRAQRKARIEWLTGSLVREATLLEVRDDIHAAAVAAGAGA